MVQELKDKEYPDRFKSLKLPSMKYRRDRGNMIKTYKFTHGKYTSKYPFTNDEDISRRGHNLKLKKGRFHTNLRQHFFSERVINLWNSYLTKSWMPQIRQRLKTNLIATGKYISTHWIRSPQLAQLLVQNIKKMRNDTIIRVLIQRCKHYIILLPSPLPIHAS